MILYVKYAIILMKFIKIKLKYFLISPHFSLMNQRQIFILVIKYVPTIGKLSSKTGGKQVKKLTF